ncbi:hypothetical protein [Micromonospora sp. NPDC048898]|uniref:hypothetical protein n=1 Tax=Micromonospora sp. NPDC048898 TaxID=3364260 RepID=UPI00371EA5FF
MCGRRAELATTKIVGYAAVVAALHGRLAPDAAVLLFGGMAKDRPYPGSTVLSTVDAGIVGLVRTLSVRAAGPGGLVRPPGPATAIRGERSSTRPVSGSTAR